MLDTNVLVSAIVHRKSFVAGVVKFIKDNHTIVMSDWVMNELERIFKKKFPDKLHDMYTDIEILTNEYCFLGEIDQSSYPTIRDLDDLPVLISGIISDVDILLTGDTDFDDVSIQKPHIMKPRQFYEEYMDHDL